MKLNTPRHTYLIVILSFLIVAIMAVLVLPAMGNEQPQVTAGFDGTPSFLPFIKKDPTPVPTPTSTSVPVPQFVSNIQTPNAECPVASGFNPLSGYAYILNDYSSNANVFHNRNWVGTIFIPPTIPTDPAGSWPVAIGIDNDSTEVYIAAVHGGVARVNGLNLVSMLERYYEPHGAVVNPISGWVYSPDLDRAIQVFNGSTLVQNIVFDMDTEWDAWFLDAVVDPDTGYVYTAGAEGIMYVIDGTDVIDSYRLGHRVVDIEIDPVRGYIYAAHNEKNDEFQNNISVFDINNETVTFLNTASRSRGIAVDPRTGLTYVTNPGPDDDPANDTVTLLIGPTVHANAPVGDRPWGVAVNPHTGYAVITNRNDNTVTIMRDGAVITTIPVQGLDPFTVTVDTNNNDFYVGNRGHEYPSPWGTCDRASVTILH
jgi:DNA-binding beta-propeller fold protein YncE